MVGPGDERTRIEGRSYVRASHADRERVIEELKAAFIQGRLDKDELDLRVGKVFASRTYADLNTLTADLPVRPAAPQPPAPAPELDSTPAREPDARKAVKAWACAAIALPGMAAGLALIGPGTAISLNLISLLMFVCVVTGPVMGLVLLHSWIEDHADGKSSPGPAARPAVKPAGDVPEIMPGLRI
jgi:Domain of unknown function (DUF1707)